LVADDEVADGDAAAAGAAAEGTAVVEAYLGLGLGSMLVLPWFGVRVWGRRGVYRGEEGKHGQTDGSDGRHIDVSCESDGCC